MGFVANFMCFPAVQTFWKSVKIWQSYRKFKGGNFFETQCSVSQGNCEGGICHIRWMRELKGSLHVIQVAFVFTQLYFRLALRLEHNLLGSCCRRRANISAGRRALLSNCLSQTETSSRNYISVGECYGCCGSSHL